MIKKLLFFFALLSFLAPKHSFAQKPEVLDRIIALVNDNIILKSDIDSIVVNYMREYRGMRFSEGLWFDILESEIDKYVMLEKAKIDSVGVTDEEIDFRLDQRVGQMIQQAGSEKTLEEYFGKTMVELKSEWREIYRQDEVINRLRQKKLSGIKITRPEVREFFNKIPKDSLPVIPERVQLAQIVKIPPPAGDAREKAMALAVQLRDSVVNHGKSIEEMARKYSMGPSAPQGGLIPLIEINQLVAEYSAAAAALEPGGISEVVETSFGFHVIRLNRKVGDKIETNHILIQLKADEVDDQTSIDELNKIRDSLRTNKKLKFADLARKHSDDKYTSMMGGIIMNPQTGERFIPLNQLDPALYRLVLLLENEGDISEPRPFTTNPPAAKKAYRIVQLVKKVEEHRANMDLDFEMLENIALQQKKQVELEKWMRELRNEIYVEYKITIPKQYQRQI